ncbi:MAG: hypothetical protein WBW92_06340 [Rhodanobacteraceae bacterium]
MSGRSLPNAASELPGILDADDLRIPAEVRSRFGDYPKAVVSVIPVTGMQRQEWWLFAAHGLLLDVLARKSPDPE